MGDYQPVFNSLASAGIVGLVVWVWALWKSHNALALKIAEEYPKTQAMKESLASAVAPLEKEIARWAKESERQGRILEAMARQMHIPAITEG